MINTKQRMFIFLLILKKSRPHTCSFKNLNLKKKKKKRLKKNKNLNLNSLIFRLKMKKKYCFSFVLSFRLSKYVFIEYKKIILHHFAVLLTENEMKTATQHKAYLMSTY